MIICTDASFMNHGTCLAGVAFDTTGFKLAWFQNDVAAIPTQAEDKAMFLATRVAEDQEWNKMLLLTDSLILVEAMATNSDSFVGYLCKGYSV